jgi:ABC-type transport system substrate-binding protein
MTGYWPLIVPDWSPADGWFANFVSPVWSQWVSTQGEEGEEPPDWYKRLHEIYREVAVTGDMSKFDSNWDEVTAIWQEQYPYFTTFFDIQIFVVHKENLGNIPIQAESSQITWFPLEVYYWEPAE